MIINTTFKDDENLELLENTINALAPGVMYSLGADYGAFVASVMLRSQAAIHTLKKMIQEKEGGDPYS